MNVAELVPTPLDRVLFKASSVRLLESYGGCYALTTFEGFILYVGLTIDFKARFNKHVEDDLKRNITTDGKAFWFYYLRCDGKNLPKIERTWQNDFKAIHGRNPILNKVDSPIS